MIQVIVPEGFDSERRYIVDLFFGEMLDLEYRVAISPQRSYKIDLNSGKSITIRDHFFSGFSDSLSYLDSKHIPQSVLFVPNPFSLHEQIPVLFGTGEMEINKDVIHCGIDIFASSFFMLTRWEEYVYAARDQYQRFPARASLAFKSGFLHRPIVNEYTELLWNMLCWLGCTQKRRERSFRCRLSHDVDEPRRWGAFSRAFLTWGGDLVIRKSLSLARDHFQSFCRTRIFHHSDPFDTFDGLMTLSENNGIISQFNFMAGGKTRFDPKYSLQDPVIASLMKHITERGHQIGFHPSYDTYRDPHAWGSELAVLAATTLTRPCVGRQHYLRFEVPTTWQIWEDYGMTQDSTLGYPEQIGFRCGICDDYPVFNILSRRKLNLRELPLLIMDVTLACYQQLTAEEAVSKIGELYKTVKRYRGEFVLLWHNSSFNTPLWRPYQEVYSTVLASCCR